MVFYLTGYVHEIRASYRTCSCGGFSLCGNGTKDLRSPWRKHRGNRRCLHECRRLLAKEKQKSSAHAVMLDGWKMGDRRKRKARKGGKTIHSIGKTSGDSFGRTTEGPRDTKAGKNRRRPSHQKEGSPAPCCAKKGDTKSKQTLRPDIHRDQVEMKMFPKIAGLFLFAIAGIALADNAFTVTVVPVKQYSLAGGATYSGWYYKYHDQLGSEHNGPIYTSEPYKNHFNLWLRVEDIKPEEVNKNPNKVLTVPVSGQLALNANYYRILSTINELKEIVIGDTKYTKSGEKGAEKLYVAEKIPPVPKTEPATPPVSTAQDEPAPIKPTENVVVQKPSDPVSAPTKTTTAPVKEFPLAWVLFGLSILSIGYLSWVITSKNTLLATAQKELAELKALFARLIASFTLQDKDLAVVVESAGILETEGDTVYLPKINRGAEVLVGDTPIVNDNMNILAAIKRSHAKYMAETAAAA